MQTERRRGRRRAGESDEDAWARLGAQYESLAITDPFGDALANPNWLAGLVQDMVKAAAPQGRGTRTMPDAETTASLVADIRGEWSMEPFPVAFAQLCAKQSAAGVAARTGLDRYKIIRLRKPAGTPGHTEPTLSELAAIAAGYRISPMYFAEYRLASVIATLAGSMTPEQTASLVRQLGAQR